ncbi:MAG TPA: hypothetical protein PLJ47_01230 [Candidatus Hydrogenedentes bacterium]|nr:hypothetical protein [Candidatus Hydrogenedentota bacterium]
MEKQTDIRVLGAALYYLPIETRVPLKFGSETLTHVTCARVRVRVATRGGTAAEGWGETPLSVQWVWPGNIPYDYREAAMKSFCGELVVRWGAFPSYGHPMTICYKFLEGPLRELLHQFNVGREYPMPWLAALVCCSAFDIAVHDAYGMALNLPIYATYNADFMNADLSHFIEPANGTKVSFVDRYPQDYFPDVIPQSLPAWHLVAGKDPVDESELDGNEPNDGYPVLLRDWIARDGLTCLKIKLRGNDSTWDFARLQRVGDISIETGVRWLTADFNCTVTDPAYVNEILDRIALENPKISEMLLYVEQPFPYEIEEHPIDVHSVSERKPLFMDESAHDWRMIRLGRALGWTGVALKTCKTQTGALLSMCWAKAHGMALMVQDLTNPMLAQIPHVLLAAHAGTIMGVETNAMQFYPDASAPEAKVHPRLYQRRGGMIDFSTVNGPGFGYRVESIQRELPAPE